jgi:hypothetical protein
MTYFWTYWSIINVTREWGLIGLYMLKHPLKQHITLGELLIGVRHVNKFNVEIYDQNSHT